MSVVTDVPGGWLNVAMRAWVDGGGDLRQVLAAVAPLIAAQERERAAAMVETSLYIMSGSKPSHLEYNPKRAKNDNHHATIAAAIRALGDAT